jgi:hypothetical protein
MPELPLPAKPAGDSASTPKVLSHEFTTAVSLNVNNLSDKEVMAKLAKLQKENDVLYAQLSLAQKQITSLKFERNILLDKVNELCTKMDKHKVDTGLLTEKEYLVNSDMEEDDELVFDRTIIERALAKVSPSTLAQQYFEESQKKAKRKKPSTAAKIKAGIEKKEDEGVNTEVEVTDLEATETEGGMSTGDELISEQDLSLPRGAKKPSSLISNLNSSPPNKKRKTNKASATNVVLKVQAVPMKDGLPILPVNLGIITIEALGAIVYDRPNYHNRRYILPVGYVSSRPYLSAVDPNASTTYHSRIADGGDSPIFEVVGDDNPSQVYQAQTSTGAWSSVVRAANAIRNREYTNSASGPDYFGLSNATVAMLIERLPNSDKCFNYQFKKFEVMNPTGGSQTPTNQTVGTPTATSTPVPGRDSSISTTKKIILTTGNSNNSGDNTSHPSSDIASSDRQPLANNPTTLYNQPFPPPVYPQRSLQSSFRISKDQP